MTRLGLSDSMRSTVSLEGTEPLHTATHRRPPRRPRAAWTIAATETSSEQQTETKSTSFVLSNPLRIVLGGILFVVLLSTGVQVLSSPLRAWTTSTPRVEEQFDQLERSISQLGRDTARLKTTANRFLQSCQETQVAASTRTEMLHIAAKRSFDEQGKTLTQEHAQVMREVLQYYAEQELKIQETRERLIKMNITLPVQIAVRPVPESWLEDEQKLIGDSGELRGDASGGLVGAMEGLAFFAEKTRQQEGSDFQRLSVEGISIQTGVHLESNQQTRVEQSTSYGSFFFYIFVVCASAIYLRNAISNTRKKELLEEKWSWPPIPKVLRRLKGLLGSVVVRACEVALVEISISFLTFCAVFDVDFYRSLRICEHPKMRTSLLTRWSTSSISSAELSISIYVLRSKYNRDEVHSD